MSLTFSAFQLIANQQKPTLDFFIEVDEEQHTTKDNTYKVNIKKVDNRFLWIYIRYGGSLPCSNEVVDTSTDQIIENPRQMNHIELNHQVFCLYDSVEYHFYLSNSKKKQFIEEYLKHQFSKDFIIKRFFKDPKAFVEQIKSIDRISFTSKQNIFSVKSGLFEDVKDIFGLGQPVNFKVDINYSGSPITEKFQQIFQNFLTKNDDREIQSLVCIGKDDSEIESIFDVTSFTQTRTLNLKKDDTGMYDAELVKQNLLHLLLDQKNV
ncbi:MAG: hypothetical protein WC680_00610 [Sulfuricurvum sp.]|jgi:hypothetical protein